MSLFQSHGSEGRRKIRNAPAQERVGLARLASVLPHGVQDALNVVGALVRFHRLEQAGHSATGDGRGETRSASRSHLATALHNRCGHPTRTQIGFDPSIRCGTLAREAAPQVHAVHGTNGENGIGIRGA